jgi:hypothetical protein
MRHLHPRLAGMVAFPHKNKKVVQMILLNIHDAIELSIAKMLRNGGVW